jgi:hypothetical protein
LIDYRKKDSRFAANTTLKTLPQVETPVFAFQRGEVKPVFCIYNFSEFSSRALLPITRGKVRIKNVLTGITLEAVDQEIKLDGYASLWLEVI